MTSDAIHISKILTHLDTVIRKNVCKQCYAATLPSTLSEKIDRYVVIDSANALYDYAAYGKAIINIFLYVRPIGNGQMNVAAMSKLETAFDNALQGDMFDNENYKVAREVAYSNTGYDNTYGMHYKIEAIRLTII